MPYASIAIEYTGIQRNYNGAPYTNICLPKILPLYSIVYHTIHTFTLLFLYLHNNTCLFRANSTLL